MLVSDVYCPGGAPWRPEAAGVRHRLELFPPQHAPQQDCAEGSPGAELSPLHSDRQFQLFINCVGPAWEAQRDGRLGTSVGDSERARVRPPTPWALPIAAAGPNLGLP